MLLDLFCGAGGAAMGYYRAGFEVQGVDKNEQRNYPFESVRADALEYLVQFGGLFDAIHASPPCQRYSKAGYISRNRMKHPDLIGPVRDALVSLGKPWIIENVEGAPMQPPAIRLCGLMFGLKVFRHRWFESSELLFGMQHPMHGERRIGKDGMCCVVGHGGGVSPRMRAQIARHGKGNPPTKKAWELAMDIDWMTRDELAQAIPPAFTQHLGIQMLRILNYRRGES
jgi:DNA (cytosine-5)-methyltransferase 1